VRAIISVFALVFQHAPPPNLPRGRGRSRGSLPARGEGWGGGYAQISLQRHLPIARPKFTICPPPLGSPREAGEPRTGSVPPASRGNLKEGVFTLTCFCELWLRDWYNTNCASRVRIYPPPSGSPRYARGTAWGRLRRRFARGTKPRVRSVPPASRGNLKEGVINCHHLAAYPLPFACPAAGRTRRVRDGAGAALRQCVRHGAGRIDHGALARVPLGKRAVRGLHPPRRVPLF
jgi:hypothetical protein